MGELPPVDKIQHRLEAPLQEQSRICELFMEVRAKLFTHPRSHLRIAIELDFRRVEFPQDVRFRPLDNPAKLNTHGVIVKSGQVLH